MIQYQILRTNIIRIVWQTITRITNDILGIKGVLRYREKLSFIRAPSTLACLPDVRWHILFALHFAYHPHLNILKCRFKSKFWKRFRRWRIEMHWKCTTFETFRFLCGQLEKEALIDLKEKIGENAWKRGSFQIKMQNRKQVRTTRQTFV